MEHNTPFGFSLDATDFRSMSDDSKYCNDTIKELQKEPEHIKWSSLETELPFVVQHMNRIDDKREVGKFFYKLRLQSAPGVVVTSFSPVKLTRVLCAMEDTYMEKATVIMKYAVNPEAENQSNPIKVIRMEWSEFRQYARDKSFETIEREYQAAKQSRKRKILRDKKAKKKQYHKTVSDIVVFSDGSAVTFQSLHTFMSCFVSIFYRGRPT